MLAFSLSLLSIALVASTHAHRLDNRIHANAPPTPSIPVLVASDIPITNRFGVALPPLNTTYYFNQLIDHDDPSKGTFKQRYWTSWQFYETGGPVILFTPGENNAASFTGYLTNVTTNGLLAQANNGTTIVLEHRFFGLSNPVDNLEDESLETLTIDQATKDLTYFAKTVKLPQPNGDKLNADAVPWILIGGSYSGALTSWTMVNQPGVFWAGYASSAVVEVIDDFWGYFEPIRQNMPKNCSADIEAVISHIDFVFTFGSKREKDAIKEQFGMADVTHLDDVAGALRNILWDWQGLQPSVGPGATFFKSCDALEVKDGVNAPASGWGLDHALPAWGSYFRTKYLPALCGKSSPENCLGTYNATQEQYTNTKVDNAGRSWFWMVCNELGFSQVGAPLGWPSLATRLVQTQFNERQCSFMFPKAFPTLQKPKIAATNQKFKGWNVNIDRLFFVNGKQDPWREATVSSDFHTRQSSPRQPIFVANGFHCSDLIVKSAIDPTIAAVQDAAVKTISKWISEFPGSKAISKSPVLPPPAPFVPIKIPANIVSATPAAVPPSVTQATGPPSGGGFSGTFAILNAMVRLLVEL